MAVMDLGKVVPEKGVDYFTEADVNSIVADVKSEISVPTKVSQLQNDSGFITSTEAQSSYQTIIQYSTMPTASASTVGKVVQFTGTTDANYTNGYFYVGTSTTESNTTTYSWENINVQPGSAGGNSYFTIETTSAILLSDNNYRTLQNVDTDKVKAFLNSGKVRVPILLKTSNDAASSQKNFWFVLSNEQAQYDRYQYYCDFHSSTEYWSFLLQLDVNGGATIYTYKRADLMKKSDVLIKTNTESYTPSGNYNPATKKYVDDSIASAITTTLGGSY